MNFTKDDILYIDLIVRTITIKFKATFTDCNSIKITYETINTAKKNLMNFIKKYNLKVVPESGGRQYVVIEDEY